MRLTNIIPIGRFKNIETGKEYNLKKGRNLERGTDVVFYLFRGQRVFVSDSDFYKKYIKNEKGISRL